MWNFEGGEEWGMAGKEIRWKGCGEDVGEGRGRAINWGSGSGEVGKDENVLDVE